MRVAEADANYLGKMGSDATDSPLGMGSGKVNSYTGARPILSETIPPNAPNGDVTSATCAEITPAPSGVLSSAEELQLATIKKNWARGWIPLFDECQFLLDLVERLRGLER